MGLKVNRGGQVSAADSGLNAVITIHSTGRKNAIPTTQAKIPQPTLTDMSRNLCGPGSRVRSGSALILCSPARLQTKARSYSAHPLAYRPRLAHDDASSNWKTRANMRSANVATMMVKMTVTTPVAAAPPTSNALLTCS